LMVLALAGDSTMTRFLLIQFFVISLKKRAVVSTTAPHS